MRARARLPEKVADHLGHPEEDAEHPRQGFHHPRRLAGHGLFVEFLVVGVVGIVGDVAE